MHTCGVAHVEKHCVCIGIGACGYDKMRKEARLFHFFYTCTTMGEIEGTLGDNMEHTVKLDRNEL